MRGCFSILETYLTFGILVGNNALSLLWMFLRKFEDGKKTFFYLISLNFISISGVGHSFLVIFSNGYIKKWQMDLAYFGNL